MACYSKNIFKPERTVVNAVKSLNFNIKPGEKVGFIGQNGAGKTTTIKMLTGTLFPSSGYCRVNGFDPTKGLMILKINFGGDGKQVTTFSRFNSQRLFKALAINV
ncbi:ATP-binding cassette domain-containing protein [Lactobacillus sp. R2/2]|nr:ATP-binding cassette domain-containing protein [Lactobacillus sp. R2/2]